MNLNRTPESEVASPFAMKPHELLAALGVPDRKGLSNEEAAQRQASSGFNELQEAPPEPRWRKFLAQFNELVVWILIVGAVISAFLGEWVDATAILAIVLLNGVLGFLQEERAEKALTALQGMSAPTAKVRRNAMLATIPAREIVLGDILELEAGDNVPADVRLIETYSFSVQEAALTGESLPVKKDAAAVLTESTALGDRRTMAYMGTIVVSGKAEAVAVGTGMRTELGKIAGLLQRQEPEPTPLQRRLAELGRVLVIICLVIVAVVFVLQLARGGNP
ncbi:MAG: HAD-IC family P-type ATPase, partial [Planctomycetaceae bacterium]|nr:HAD-IC family P-type ATPase [Planctomycetaceae bacterium]